MQSKKPYNNILAYYYCYFNSLAQTGFARGPFVVRELSIRRQKGTIVYLTHTKTLRGVLKADN